MPFYYSGDTKSFPIFWYFENITTLLGKYIYNKYCNNVVIILKFRWYLLHGLRESCWQICLLGTSWALSFWRLCAPRFAQSGAVTKCECSNMLGLRNQFSVWWNKLIKHKITMISFESICWGKHGRYKFNIVHSEA